MQALLFCLTLPPVGKKFAGDNKSPVLLQTSAMIDKSQIEQLVSQRIADTDLFLVEVKVDTQNNIVVSLDSPQGVDVETCVFITKFIEENVDREVEDYSLEVTSPGIGQPLKVLQQYTKVIDKTVEVLFLDGKKIGGILKDANEQGILLEFVAKEKPEGAKRPKLVTKTEPFAFSEIKSVIETIIF